MENSYFQTSIVIGLFFSYLLTGLCHGKIRTLSETLKGMNKVETYQKIKNIRRRNFIIGILTAIIASILYWMFTNEVDQYAKIINTLLILLLIPMVIYMIIPKKQYFLQTVQTNKEVQQWFDIYKCMQQKMIYGFFIFFGISLLTFYLISKKN
jgi:uncharacterized membrane protein YfcA